MWALGIPISDVILPAGLFSWFIPKSVFQRLAGSHHVLRAELMLRSRLVDLILVVHWHPERFRNLSAIKSCRCKGNFFSVLICCWGQWDNPEQILVFWGWISSDKPGLCVCVWAESKTLSRSDGNSLERAVTLLVCDADPSPSLPVLLLGGLQKSTLLERRMPRLSTVLTQRVLPVLSQSQISQAGLSSVCFGILWQGLPLPYLYSCSSRAALWIASFGGRIRPKHFQELPGKRLGCAVCSFWN